MTWDPDPPAFFPTPHTTLPAPAHVTAVLYDPRGQILLALYDRTPSPPFGFQRRATLPETADASRGRTP